MVAIPEAVDPQDYLEQLDDDQLWDLIRANLFRGNERPGVWQALMLPGVHARVKQILAGRIAVVDGELSARRSALEVYRNDCFKMGPEGKQLWFDAEADHNRWRAKAARFKRALQERLSQAKGANRADHQDRTETERRQLRNIVRALAMAIDTHRRASAAAGIDPEPHDRALWDALGQHTVTYRNGEVSLADMLEQGTWG